MVKLNITVLLLILVSFKVLAMESTLNEPHFDWQSRVVYDNDQIRFRAATTYAESGDFVVLAIDRYPKNCSAQFLTMNIVAPSPAEANLITDTLFGAIRVDENSLHNMSYTITLEGGQKVFFVDVTNFDGEETLLEELKTGKFLRFKLKQGKDEYYLRFSLQGFDVAQERTLALCQSFTKDKSDKDYFKSKPNNTKTKIKDDKNYF